LLGDGAKGCYAPWIKARQDKLEEAVRSTWEEPKLKLKVIQGGGA
jgi:hypothetical protein